MDKTKLIVGALVGIIGLGFIYYLRTQGGLPSTDPQATAPAATQQQAAPAPTQTPAASNPYQNFSFRKD